MSRLSPIKALSDYLWCLPPFKWVIAWRSVRASRKSNLYSLIRYPLWYVIYNILFIKSIFSSCKRTNDSLLKCRLTNRWRGSFVCRSRFKECEFEVWHRTYICANQSSKNLGFSIKRHWSRRHPCLQNLEAQRASLWRTNWAKQGRDCGKVWRRSGKNSKDKASQSWSKLLTLLESKLCMIKYLNLFMSYWSVASYNFRLELFLRKREFACLNRIFSN